MERTVIDLDDEHDRLVSDIDTLAEQLAELDTSTEQYKQLDQRATRLDAHRRGVEYARNEWEADSVELRPLTIGDDVRLDEHASGPGERRLWQIAIGTADAPFLEHDVDAYPDVPMDDVEATVAAIDREVPIATGRWLQSRIDEVSAVGNRTGAGSFATSLAERLTQETSTTE